MNESFRPEPAQLVAIEPLAERVRLFSFRHERALQVDPGQFAEVVLPGVGSFPVSACGYVAEGIFQACIHNVGRVTGALFRCGVGDIVGLRGPFGTGFPLASFAGRDLLLMAGGLGIAPVRALLQRVLVLSLRSLTLHYGARRAADLLFLPELEALAAGGTLHLRLAVEEPLEPVCLPALWHRGLVTDLVTEIDGTNRRLSVVACGPPRMYTALLERLAGAGVAADRIHATLERRMRCGIGECGHCVAGGRYVCCEGPVFSLAQLRQMPGAIA